MILKQFAVFLEMIKIHDGHSQAFPNSECSCGLEPLIQGITRIMAQTSPDIDRINNITPQSTLDRLSGLLAYRIGGSRERKYFSID